MALYALHEAAPILDSNLPVAALFPQLADDLTGRIGAGYPADMTTGDAPAIGIDRQLAVALHNALVDQATAFTGLAKPQLLIGEDFGARKVRKNKELERY